MPKTILRIGKLRATAFLLSSDKGSSTVLNSTLSRLFLEPKERLSLHSQAALSSSNCVGSYVAGDISIFGGTLNLHGTSIVTFLSNINVTLAGFKELPSVDIDQFERQIIFPNGKAQRT